MTDQRATPQDYQYLFEQTGSVGERVYNDLARRFGSHSPYVRGGHEAERESCYRAGRRSVIDYVVKQVNRANGVKDDPVSDSDE